MVISKALYTAKKKNAARPKPTGEPNQPASYRLFRSSSVRASRIASSSSKKQGTKCEMALRTALRKRRISFSTNARDIAGRPDVVFRAKRMIVFVDGDFWHGRNLKEKLKRLSLGANKNYWTQKIQSNVRRDLRTRRKLRRQGWSVLHAWETDIHKDPEKAAHRIATMLSKRQIR
jgi:DNA mismatch endonuclease, patch repair protein